MQVILGRWIDPVTSLSQVFNSSPSPAEKSQSLSPNNPTLLPKLTLTVLYLPVHFFFSKSLLSILSY